MVLLLKTLQNAQSLFDDYVKIIVCHQSDLEDDLRNSPTFRTGSHNGAQIKLAANAQLKAMPGLNASDEDYYMNSHHEQRGKPISLHSPYYLILVLLGKFLSDDC